MLLDVTFRKGKVHFTLRPKMHARWLQCHTLNAVDEAMLEALKHILRNVFYYRGLKAKQQRWATTLGYQGSNFRHEHAFVDEDGMQWVKSSMASKLELRAVFCPVVAARGHPVHLCSWLLRLSKLRLRWFLRWN